MTANVFANGREISAKKDDNKSMGAMPDVCLSPPSPPAGPLPIPYPNFSKSSDTSGGTKTVKIKGKEAGIKNSSNYKKSKGNEPATRSFGMGVVSHALSGKMQHAAWSMDVKFEGKNVIRFLDLTTHNHGSQTNGGLTVNIAAFKKVMRKTDCKELKTANKAATSEKRPKAKTVATGTTIATAKWHPPSGAGMQTSSSSHMSDFANKNGWSHGNKDENGQYEESGMCDGAKEKLKPVYTTTGRGKSQSPMCHAESRIIESVFKAGGPRPGGSLTLSIDWRPSGGGKRSTPCKKCKDMLCAVQKECGLKIRICKPGKKKPKDLKC